MTRRVRDAALLFGALAASCTGAPEGGGGASVSLAVAGGEISGPADDFVVQIRSDQPEPYDDATCSGTLVAPNLVLTALHCVTVFDTNAAYGCEPDGSATPSGAGWIGEPLDPASVEVYFGTELPLTVSAHGSAILGSHATFACVDDIAFVVLDTALPAGGVALRNERAVVRGESLTVIGYGVNDLEGDVARTRRSGVTVLDVGPDDTSDGTGNLPARNFIVGDGPTTGDNGGPALSDETGAVIGVFRQSIRGTGVRSGSHGAFVELMPLMSLAGRAFEAAGAKLRLETAPSPERRPAPSCALTPARSAPTSAAPALAVLGLLLFRRRRVH